MSEIHPFGAFVPLGSIYLFLGSFAAKQVTGYDWFFSNGRNQFWPIMEEVYHLKFPTKKDKQQLFIQLRMGITDIILSCERKADSNLDTNLSNMIFNTKAIFKIVRKNNIKVIYFSSRFAENLFKKHFKQLMNDYPKISLITLPSSSPRYAMMSKQEKVKRYRELLPKLSVAKTLIGL